MTALQQAINDIEGYKVFGEIIGIELVLRILKDKVNDERKQIIEAYDSNIRVDIRKKGKAIIFSLDAKNKSEEGEIYYDIKYNKKNRIK